MFNGLLAMKTTGRSDPSESIQGSQFLMYWHDVFVLFFGDVEISCVLPIDDCMLHDYDVCIVYFLRFVEQICSIFLHA